ncbi:hypothetical protein GDI1206 [Gluconacetobacter diazotrophicus PA1 5]|uniref:Uncharacterized protein n=3 Tax=Gluconacetobacter diazotrophicus TaxID=33996 RepID=A9HDV5_GLUDA|nr:hypothetical protein GDI1206 [Gluconacetobacter diazotrophicus PA1 5]
MVNQEAVMSSKGHPHKHTPGRHKAPHYGAAHYAKSSTKTGTDRLLDLRDTDVAGRVAKPGAPRGK